MSTKKLVLFYGLLIILCLLMLEAGLHMLNFFAGWMSAATEPPVWASLQQNFRTPTNDTGTYQLVYHPFLGTRSAEYHGGSINVNAEHLRESWNPNFRAEENPKQVFLFGGSTMWGVGVSDAETIASQVSRQLNRNKPSYEITNYGDMGHSNNVELIHLVTLLKEGKVPDYVIFYDGVNDVLGAFNSGTVNSSTIHEQIRLFIYNSPRTGWQHITYGFGQWLKDYSMITRSFLLLKDAVQGKKPGLQQLIAYEQEDLDILAEKLVQNYENNIRFIQTIAPGYGFEARFFWQPCLYTEAVIMPEEEAGEPLLKIEDLKYLYNRVNQILREWSHPGFYNISDIFGNRNRVYYLDFCHINAEGNALVAQRMADLMQQDGFLVCETELQGVSESK